MIYLKRKGYCYGQTENCNKYIAIFWIFVSQIHIGKIPLGKLLYMFCSRNGIKTARIQCVIPKLFTYSGAANSYWEMKGYIKY